MNDLSQQRTGAELADTVAQAAANLNMSRAHAYREITAGRLRSYKAGKLRRVSRDAQRDYIRDRERESAPPYRPAAR